jgi:hypothetical protein
MSPLDAAFHDFADANQGAEGYACFVGGWSARGDVDLDRAAAVHESTVALAEEERERTRVYWQTKVASVEAERDCLIQRLATVAYERESFRRQRDAVAGMLERARDGG